MASSLGGFYVFVWGLGISFPGMASSLGGISTFVWGLGSFEGIEGFLGGVEALGFRAC